MCLPRELFNNVWSAEKHIIILSGWKEQQTGAALTSKLAQEPLLRGLTSVALLSQQPFHFVPINTPQEGIKEDKS